jgi:Leucine-rich repeat (LRR) protein
MAASFFFVTTIILFFSILINIASCVSDIDSLLKLKNSLQNTDVVLSSWNTSAPPCTGDDANWSGVLCYKGHVWGFKLENMNLKGNIDVDSIKDLPYIRTLSLMNNQFDTPWPDLNKLSGLKTLYLSNNKFSGEIPADAFHGMQWLKKIHLSNNQFTGPIPTSLSSLPRLISLRLDGNRFNGPIPEFRKPLKSFSAANNQLEGEIPASLSNIPALSFSGMTYTHTHTHTHEFKE